MPELYRTRLEDYSKKYASFFTFKRQDGILEIKMHTRGGPLLWNLEIHSALVPALRDINDDPENEILIITGTGDSFLGGFDGDSWAANGFNGPYSEKQAYDIMFRNQTREPFSLIDLQIPVIAAVNGPVVVHGELALLNDIVIASNNTYFYDGHFDGLGIVPGDGVQTLYRELLGHNRSRYFIYMGEKIYADEAKQLGLVSEVVPLDKVLDRAWGIARTKLLPKARVQRRLTRSLLIQPWREIFTKEMNSGMAHEALGCFTHWPMTDNAYDPNDMSKN
jgi:enoyl-CoA hydratase/carnithine racemase